MPEISIAPETKEKNTTYPGIRFESAQHSLTGNFPPNVPWFNQEVSKRLAEYHPSVLAIDSVNPIDTIYATGTIGILNETGSRFVNEMIPGPMESVYQGHDTITVIVGDNVFSTLSTLFLDGQNQDHLLTNSIDQLSQEMYSTLPELLSKPGAETTLLLAGLAISRVGHDQKDPTLTRRQFFNKAGKTAAVLGGSALMAQMGSLFGATIAPSEQSKNMLLDTANFVDSLVTPTRQKIIYGRTALQIAQLQDTIDYLGLPKDTPAAVIHGWMHGYGANELLTNKDKRNQAIADLYKIHVQATKETCIKLGVSESKRSEVVTNWLPNLFTNVGLAEVEVQAPHKITRPLPFKSPQILSAIQSAREV